MNTTIDNNTFFELDYSYQTELYKLYNRGSNKFKFLKEEVAKNIFSILKDAAERKFLEDINFGNWEWDELYIIKNKENGIKIKIEFKLWHSIDKDKLPLFPI